MKKDAKFINNVKVEGYVYSTGSSFNQLAERTTGEKSKNPGTKYISGDLDVAVDENGLNVVTVHYTYVTEKYGNGKANSTFTTLKRIIDNPDKHWINGGKENAFKVLCTGAALGLNDFIAGDGSKVAALRNENGFCSIVNELGPENDRNTFSTDMLITKVIHVDADEERNIKEDYTTVNGAIFGYGPKLLPVSFVMRHKDGMNYFESLDASNASPVFTKVWGRIMTIKVEKKEESAFGEAIVRTYERKNREYLITGAARVPYDFGEEEVLTIADVNKMTQDRQILLAEIEKRYNDRKNEKSNTITANAQVIPEGGFVF